VTAVFPGWRNVGLAMRAARQQPDVRIDALTVISLAKVTDNRWQWPGTRVIATHAVGYDRTDVEISRADAKLTFYGVSDAIELLRVLAALGLIPAHLAEQPDERYGRCARCGRLAQWWHDSPFFPRWVHVPPLSAAQPGVHRAEVADIPPDLAEAGPATAPTQEHHA
jgi:hypothetical protein